MVIQNDADRKQKVASGKPPGTVKDFETTDISILDDDTTGKSSNCGLNAACATEALIKIKAK